MGTVGWLAVGLRNIYEDAEASGEGSRSQDGEKGQGPGAVLTEGQPIFSGGQWN